MFTAVSEVLKKVLLKFQAFWVVKQRVTAFSKGLYCLHLLGQAVQEE
jgi:hypothetical protein